MKINLSALKARFLRSNRDQGNEIPLKDMDILDHIEKIVELAKEQGITKCLVSGKKHVDYVAEKLGISSLQAALFSLFVENSDSNCIEMGDIAEAAKSSIVMILKYDNECEILDKKKLIRRRKSDNSVSYRVPMEVKEALRKNSEYHPAKNENLDIGEFFTVLEKLFFIENVLAFGKLFFKNPGYAFVFIKEFKIMNAYTVIIFVT